MDAAEFRELLAGRSDADMLPVCLMSEERVFVSLGANAVKGQWGARRG